MSQLDVGVHIAGALLAVVLGGVILAMPKGTARHKLMGRIWVGVMVVVAAGSFRLHGLNASGGFSGIHFLSIFTLVSMAYAIYMIRRGNKIAHFSAMIGCLIGLILAGVFTLSPDRIIGGFLFGS